MVILACVLRATTKKGRQHFVLPPFLPRQISSSRTAPARDHHFLRKILSTVRGSLLNCAIHCSKLLLVSVTYFTTVHCSIVVVFIIQVDSS